MLKMVLVRVTGQRVTAAVPPLPNLSREYDMKRAFFTPGRRGSDRLAANAVAIVRDYTEVSGTQFVKKIVQVKVILYSPDRTSWNRNENEVQSTLTACALDCEERQAGSEF